MWQREKKPANYPFRGNKQTYTIIDGENKLICRNDNKIDSVLTKNLRLHVRAKENKGLPFSMLTSFCWKRVWKNEMLHKTLLKYIETF